MKVYLSEEQYKQLLKDGSITVGETIIIYNENDDYITSFDDCVDLTSRQVIEGTKIFTGSVDYTGTPSATSIGKNGVQIVGSDNSISSLVDSSSLFFNDDNNGYTTYSRTGIHVLKSDIVGDVELTFPTRSGTLATMGDIKQLYKHNITILFNNSNVEYNLTVELLSTNSEQINTSDSLMNLLGIDNNVMAHYRMRINEQFVKGFQVEYLAIWDNGGEPTVYIDYYYYDDNTNTLKFSALDYCVVTYVNDIIVRV